MTGQDNRRAFDGQGDQNHGSVMFLIINRDKDWSATHLHVLSVATEQNLAQNNLAAVLEDILYSYHLAKVDSSVVAT